MDRDQRAWHGVGRFHATFHEAATRGWSEEELRRLAKMWGESESGSEGLMEPTTPIDESEPVVPEAPAEGVDDTALTLGASPSSAVVFTAAVRGCNKTTSSLENGVPPESMTTRTLIRVAINREQVGHFVFRSHQ